MSDSTPSPAGAPASHDWFLNRLQPGGHVDDAGRYVLERRIATGGMGEVWAARDTVLERPVAAKVLRTELADDSVFRARFVTEARNAGALHHPGIAAVFDYGEARPGDGSDAQRPYLVMELVKGEPLSTVLASGQPLDADVARSLLTQAALALGFAHEAGIVHRDVKPANLLVTADRHIKVTDFGIARATDGLALTEVGQVLGTPAYIAPEQARGDDATPASDVYSLGVVAYECLTGHRPYVADTPVATALAHLHQPVPELPDTVPAHTREVVRRALAKDPQDRYPNGKAFAHALAGPRADATLAVPAAATGSTTTRVLPTGAPAGTTSIRPPSSATAAPASAHGGGLPRWLLAGVVAAAVAMVLIVWLATRGENPADPADPVEPQDAPSQNATQTPTQTPTQESSPPEPATAQVDPDAYLGRDHKDVTKELQALGLTVTEEEVANPGDVGEGLVTALQPTGAVPLEEPVVVSYAGKQPEGEGDGNEGGGNEGEGNGNEGRGNGNEGGGNGNEGGGNGNEGGGNGNEGGGNGGEGNGTQGRDG
ncbi:serine/threonine-protein kinase [uncultured Nocardioides sp.]|uniref:non-specific serine/threonine protein kinase n=1 Tax=uncultured Nocardioides sp. TaxID=198441 RepID=A0A6J4P295_9ACTN|nr:serine/threonine-protein kinase [uncultured Nocardioides sp.]CAA9404172.1 MAG: Serine/threonine protein kinase PrkC, regulator of stationary phase [uncultured Nocardioides sp.]